VTWKCKVEYLIQKSNLGCRNAVAEAISWLFEKTEQGIILEDDCLPVPQFFPFCTNLLDRYRNEQRVGQIGGFNCQFGRVRGSASYYFSKYFHVWGWASWRRAWAGFDIDMKDYDLFLEERALERLFSRRSIRDFWKDNFEEVARRGGNTWDYQWAYHNFKMDRLAVVPNWNMVENIGFGDSSTHTGSRNSRLPDPVHNAPREIVHPSFILPCPEADDYTYRHHLRLGRFHDVKQVAKGVLEFRRKTDV
jgi:hypothetical protein